MVPTLLRQLLTTPEADCTRWTTFQHYWWRAVEKAVAKGLVTGRPETMRISESTFERWLAGDSVARGAARTILQDWLGFTPEQLSQPAPAFSNLARPRVDGRTLITARAELNFRWPTSRLSLGDVPAGTGGTWSLDGGPLGKTTIAAYPYEATLEGRKVRLDKDNTHHATEQARTSSRGMMLVSLASTGSNDLYLTDVVHTRTLAAGDDFLLPDAYRLDDLTFALTWALHILDNALLADNAHLVPHENKLLQYADMDTSAPRRDTAADLHPASTAWLSSSLCATYILRHLPELPGTPVFWTKEQSGAECAPWLFWSHKTHYLSTLAAQLGTERTGRVFCIPHDMVMGTHSYERVLIFLCMAAMERHGLTAVLVNDADYAVTEGFVLGGDQAIVASWVREEPLWRVARTRSAVRYQDAARYARAHTVLTGPDSGSRLRELADYLALDWTWLSTRARDLAKARLDGMLAPRSRNVSLDEISRTLQYVGGHARRPAGSRKPPVLSTASATRRILLSDPRAPASAEVHAQLRPGSREFP